MMWWLSPLGGEQNGGEGVRSWEVASPRWYSWVFPMALGAGLAVRTEGGQALTRHTSGRFISRKPRCLRTSPSLEDLV
jgi:hypothetical protein